MIGFAAAILVFSAQPGVNEAIGGEVLLLKSSVPGVDAQRLLETASIYTRDLGVVVREGPTAPVVVSPDEIRRLGGLGAVLTFWCSRDAAGSRLLVQVVRSTTTGDRFEIVSFPVEQSEDAYRAIGLKLRTIIASRRSAVVPAASGATPAVPSEIRARDTG